MFDMLPPSYLAWYEARNDPCLPGLIVFEDTEEEEQRNQEYEEYEDIEECEEYWEYEEDGDMK